jgi:hypothetical protein
MVNTKMFVFKHPKYYKELRKRNRDLSELQQVKLERSVPQSDQVISDEAATAATSVHPGPGLKFPGPRPISNANKGLIHRRQASSTKPQAPSVKLSNQPVQASSDKHQAPSNKLQAPSHKQQAPRS